MLGSVMDEELDDKELRAALGGERERSCEDAPFGKSSSHLLAPSTIQCVILILKCSPCTVVMQYSSTSYDSVFFSHSMCYHVSVMRFRKFAFLIRA